MVKFISVIIPCRNEEKFIAGCLDCVLGQDYSLEQMEILIVDGGSTDDTRKILEAYAQKTPQVRWFDNPGKIVPTGLNILIGKARGDVVVRLDAHAEYPKDYISKCVCSLINTGADNVGGVCVTLPGANTLTAKAIALVLASNFGVGNALFRTGVKEITPADTVPFGCFRKDVFDRFGLFDEDLVRGQDSEFNHRIIKNGGKIFLLPDVVSYYHARDTFSKLARMYSQYGYFKAFVSKKLQMVLTVRQLVPSLFVILLGLSLVAGLLNPWFYLSFAAVFGLYLITNLIFSVKIAIAHEVWLLPFLITGFLIIHINYGIHYLRGICDFWILRKHHHNKISDVPLTR